MNQQRRGMLLTIVSAILFGLNPLLAKTVYGAGSNSLTLTFARVLAGAFIFYGLHHATEKCSIRVSTRQLGKLAICALGYAGAPVLLFTSYNYLASGMATTIHFVYPVLVLVGCVLFRHERLDRRRLLCCLLCVGGILSFYTPGGSVSLTGVLISFLSGVAYAFYIVYLSSSGLLQLPPFQLAFWLCLIGAGGIGLLALGTGQMAWPSTLPGWAVLVLFVLSNAAATFTFQEGNKLVGAQSASLLSTFEPLTSVFVGILIYHEALTLQVGLGIVCILAAVCLLASSREAPHRQCPLRRRCRKRLLRPLHPIGKRGLLTGSHAVGGQRRNDSALFL